MTSQRQIIIQQGNNPSSEFYFCDLLQKAELMALHELPAACSGQRFSLLFIRYISSAWQRWIDKHLDLIDDLTLFIDDDLFDMKAWQGLPWRYRFKLYRLSYSRQRWLQRHGAKLVVSTDYLATKYMAWQPTVKRPQPLSNLPRSIVVFYHGSASHQQDLVFVKAVMQRVMALSKHICFEVIGDQQLYKTFKSVPNTVVVQPMAWGTYKLFNQLTYRDIGLVPLVDNGFNRARSHTKSFDIAQAGAVGVYAANSPYSDYLEASEQSHFVAMDVELWVDKILELATQLQPVRLP